MSEPKAKYRITAEDDSAAGWRSALARADANGKKLKATLGYAFAGVISAQMFTSQISSAIEFGDEIGKLTTKLALGAKETTELVAAAKLFDIELEDISKSLQKMQIAISQAGSGNKKVRETFKALGVDFNMIRTLAPDKQFELLGDAISKLENPADRTRAAVEIFGKAGAALLPMFEQGAQGIRAARDQVRAFGAALDDDQVRKLQEADDALKNLNIAFTAMATTLTAKLAPALTFAVEKLHAFLNPSLNAQLADLAQERKYILERISSVKDGFDGFFLSDAEEKQALESWARSLADVEGRMNAINAQLKQTQQNALAAPNTTAKPPGFLSKDKSIFATAKDWQVTQKEIDEQMRSSFETRRTLIDGFDQAIRDGFFQTFEELPEKITNIEEPMVEFSESLLRAEAIQEEFSRSMFNNFSDLFYSIGEGTDEWSRQFLSTIKRTLSDRAALALFDLLGGTGSSASTSGSGGGFWAGVGSFVSSMFGGYKASGGRLEQNKWYIAGERGAEPIWGGGPGAFAMGYGGGSGGVNVNSTYHIDARGASSDAVPAMQAMLNQRDERLKADIIGGIQRGKYRISR